MQVKTFEAQDMKQALRMVKEQLGPRAVIVASRTVRRDGGLFGLLGRTVLEVTAATEDEPEERISTDAPPRATAQPGQTGRPGAPIRPAARAARNPEIYNDLRAMKQAMDPVLDEIRAIRDTVTGLDPRGTSEVQDLRSDVAQIRTLLSSLVGAGSLTPDAHGAAAQKLFYFLLTRGIDDPLARSLVQRVVARIDSGGLADLERMKLNLAAEMRADLNRATRGSAPSRVQIFVGSTGVGKSTTIAKLASRAASGSDERVKIITTDTHRIAAVDQMMRFGETLNIPVEVAVGPEDLARRAAASEARIFIDTPGRNHRDAGTLRSISRMIEAVPDAEIMLVLSATTRSVDSREMMTAYAELGFSRLILTKLDETRVHGELYNCIARSNRPIACVTTGQAVPEHLESLDVAGILKKVLHG